MPASPSHYRFGNHARRMGEYQPRPATRLPPCVPSLALCDIRATVAHSAKRDTAKLTACGLRPDFCASGVCAGVAAYGVSAQRILDAPNADLAAVAAREISPRPRAPGFNAAPGHSDGRCLPSDNCSSITGAVMALRCHVCQASVSFFIDAPNKRALSKCALDRLPSQKNWTGVEYERAVITVCMAASHDRV
jgi:hypothetical protein